MRGLNILKADHRSRRDPCHADGVEVTSQFVVQTGRLHLGFQCPIAELSSDCSPMARTHRFVAFCDVLACAQHAMGVGTRNPRRRPLEQIFIKPGHTLPVPWHVFQRGPAADHSQHHMGRAPTCIRTTQKTPPWPSTAPAYICLTCHRIVPAPLAMPIQLACTER